MSAVTDADAVQIESLNGRRKFAFPTVHTFNELFPESSEYVKNSPNLASWESWECGTWSDKKRDTRTHLSGYCRIDGESRTSILVKPSDSVTEWIKNNVLLVPWDTITFTIYVRNVGRSLQVIRWP